VERKRAVFTLERTDEKSSTSLDKNYRKARKLQWLRRIEESFPMGRALIEGKGELSLTSSSIELNDREGRKQ